MRSLQFTRRSTCIGLLLLIACSTPPDKERGQAEGAIAAARAASADVYAPDDLRAAEAALSRYDAAVAQGDYREALNAALDARDRAYAAVRRAGTAQADARVRAEQLTHTLENLLETLSRRLTGAATPRITTAAAPRVRAVVSESRQTLQEARSAIERGAYQDAVTRLEAAVAGLQKETDGGTRRGRS